MSGIIKKTFIVLLTSIVNTSNHIKCVLLSNQKCMTQPALIDLHPNEYSQEFHYYPFTVKLGKCVRSCITLNDLSNKVCVLSKTEDLNVSVFNMIIGTNESKTLTKHISYKRKCKFDARKCNSDQWYNNDKCQCEFKKYCVCEKNYAWNPATWSCENEKCLASIMDDSATACDEIIESYDEETKTIPTNFNGKKATCKLEKL